MDAGLAPILFVLVVLVTAMQSQITTGPKNALKKVGDSFKLDCVKKGSNCDDIEWKKMEGAQSPLIVYRDGKIFNGFKERYSVNSTVDCSLTITQLQISDSGKFSCSLTVDSSEVTKGSILVVIDVTESCRPLTSITELTEGDVYGFSTAINVPAKSVEPSNVTLSFQKKAAGETVTMDDKQPPTTVKSTLTGTMIKANVTPHECNASFTPTTVDNFDSSNATMNICTTQQLIVLYPVEDVTVSPSGSYYKGATVSCAARGHPHPTFEWKPQKSGDVTSNTLVIDGEAGDKYTCTATNTVKGNVASRSVTIEVSTESSCGAGCIAPIICVVVGVIIIILVVLVVCYKFKWCPFHAKFHSIMGKQSSDKNGERAGMPLNPPDKPPRASDTPVPANV